MKRTRSACCWLSLSALLTSLCCTVASAQPLQWSSESHLAIEADFNQDGQRDLLLQAKVAGHKHYFVPGQADASRRLDYAKRIELPAKLAALAWSADQVQLLPVRRSDKVGHSLLVLPKNAEKALRLDRLSSAADLSQASQVYEAKHNKWLQDIRHPVYFSGDFDGDGQPDLLQLDTEHGAHQLVLQSKNGQFKTAKKLSKVVRWGLKNSERLLIRDFNKDGQDDIFALSRDGKQPHLLLYSDGQGGFIKDDGKQIAVQQASLTWADNAAGIVAVTRKSDQQTLLFRAYNSAERAKVAAHCLGWVYDTEADNVREYCPATGRGQAWDGVAPASGAAHAGLSDTGLSDCPVELSVGGPVTTFGSCDSGFIMPDTPGSAPQASYGPHLPGAQINVVLAATGDFTALTYEAWLQNAAGVNQRLGDVAAPTWLNPVSGVSLKVSLPAAGTYMLMYRACHANGCSGFSPSTTVLVQAPVTGVAGLTVIPAAGTYSGSVTVSLSTATAGATIRYTSNGTDVSPSSAVYSGAVTLTSSTTLKARAYKDGMTPSAQSTLSYVVNPLPVVATPTANPGSGTYAGSVTVNLASATAGATIRYTTNGDDVSSHSPVYSAALVLTSATTVKAKAFKSGMTDSAQSSHSYQINPLSVVAAPTANPAAGTYSGSVTVNLSSATTGATIRYTTDGSAVSSSSPVYSDALVLTSSTTVRAKASKPGMTDSAQSALSYTINPIPVAGTPAVNPAAGTFTGSVRVSLVSATPGATIRYTTNGANVSSSSPAYTAAFTLTGTTTVKARAYKSGMTASAQAAFVFTRQPNNQIVYLHTDVLGSVVAETDASGKISKKTEYKPFGESKDN